MWQRQAVALRPLGAGERIDAAIKIVRSSFLTFAKASLVIAVPLALFGGFIGLSMASSLQSILPATGSAGQVAKLNTSGLQTLFGGLAVEEIVTWVGFTMITAIAVRIVANTYLGQPTGWKEAVASGAKRLHSVLWIQLLLGVLILGTGVAVGLVGLVALSAHAGAALFLLGSCWVVFAVWMWVASSLSVPVLMIENLHGWKAVRRSISLARRQWWPTFGTLLLAGLLGLIVTSVLRVVLAFLLGLFGKGSAATLVESVLVSLLTSLLFASFFAAVQVVITIDLRVRKEGFDIQLLASQMGGTPSASALSFMPAPPGGATWGHGGPYPPPPAGPWGGYPPGPWPAQPPPPPAGPWGGYQPGPWPAQPPPPPAPPQGWAPQEQPGWPRPAGPPPQAGPPQQPGWRPPPPQGWTEPVPRPLPRFQPRGATPEPEQPTPDGPPAEAPASGPAGAEAAGAEEPPTPPPPPPDTDPPRRNDSSRDW